MIGMGSDVARRRVDARGRCGGVERPDPNRQRRTRWLLALFAAIGCLGCFLPEEHTAPEDDPVEAAVQALGTPVTGCANGGFANGTLTLSVDGAGLVLDARGGRIRANGHLCMGSVANVVQPLTTTHVSRLEIVGDASANKVVLDLLPGPLGSRILSSSGGIAVDFATASGGADSFMVRGTSNADTFKFARNVFNSDVFVELSKDRIADVRVRPGASLRLVASLGRGADVVNAKPLGTDMSSYRGAALSIQPLHLGLTAYGGPGNDVFTSGAGDDVFYGGDDNDTIKASAHPDGNDVYSGGEGTDLVDYGVRTAAVRVDIAPPRVARTSQASLSSLDYAQLAGTTLVFALDGGSDVSVMFANPASPGDVIAAIDAEAGASVASLSGANQLTIMTPSSTSTSSVEIKASSTAIVPALLDMASGISSTVPGTTTPVDADDGQAGEADDVRSDIENLYGGSGDDTLVGSGGKNLLKGGVGNDRLSGGSRPCAPELTVGSGDLLQGEAGDDVIFVPVPNCWAVSSGGIGADTANFAARTAPVFLSNDNVANDGETNERVGIGVDIETLIGGWGDDTLTGGSGSDILVGGPGGDVLNGGGGSADVADYSAYTAPTDVSLCFASTLAACGVANDGAGEGDQVYMIERVIGGSDVDTFTVLDDAATNVTFEGGDGDDVLTGGAGNDTLVGAAGNDTLRGGAGDDLLNGGTGVDDVDGGDGDGDVCSPDVVDAPPAVRCEG